MLIIQNISLMFVALLAGSSFVVQQAVNSNLRF